MTTMIDPNPQTEVEELPVIALTLFDRCDGCGAGAVMQANKGDDALLFCYHHKQKHEDALLNAGWEVVEDIAAISRLN